MFECDYIKKGAWFLLSEVSGFLLKVVDWEFLHHHWQLLDKQESSNCSIEEDESVGLESNSVDWAGDRVALLQTISNVSVELPIEPAAELAHNLLKRIEDFSMHPMELSIPGCTRLSSEGILNNLKDFNSSTCTSGIKHLRTGGFYGITHDQYKQLKCLLTTDNNTHQITHIPHYYHRGNLYLQSDDNHDLDIEICPWCQNVRLVYDCPAESYRVKDQYGDLCRACIICIPRCAHCGRCVHNSEYEETFSLEYLCSGCVKELPIRQMAQPMEVDVFDG